MKVECLPAPVTPEQALLAGPQVAPHTVDKLSPPMGRRWLWAPRRGGTGPSALGRGKEVASLPGAAGQMP